MKTTCWSRIIFILFSALITHMPPCQMCGVHCPKASADFLSVNIQGFRDSFSIPVAQIYCVPIYLVAMSTHFGGRIWRPNSYDAAVK
jgi:hypothetical protein